MIRTPAIRRHTTRHGIVLGTLMLWGCADDGPCSANFAVPDDCAVSDVDGMPLEHVCHVEGDSSFAEGTVTCGRAEARYRLLLCQDDPDRVTDDVLDDIVCVLQE